MNWLRRLWLHLRFTPPINIDLDYRAAPILPTRDTYEGTAANMVEPRAVAVSLDLRYRDAAGSVTERIVDVQKFGMLDDRLLLFGFCRLRQARRSFRADRIMQCVDIETGEIVSDVAAYLHRHYERSPYCARDRLRTEHADALRILFYVSKADGFLRARERALFRDACRILASAPELPDALLDALFKELEVPSVHQFKRAVNRLKTEDAARQRLMLTTAEAMIATDKKPHQSETDAVAYLRKQWKIPTSTTPP